MIAVTTVPVSVVKTAAEAVEGVGSEVAGPVGRLSVDPAGVDAWLVVSVVVVNAVEAHSLAAGSSAAGTSAAGSSTIVHFSSSAGSSLGEAIFFSKCSLA